MAITLKRQLNDEEKQIIYNRFGRKCFATGHEIPEDERIQYDHIRAFSLGGASELDNIAPMCEHHNKAKGTLALEDYRIKLKLEDFFKGGDRQTLKHLLEYLKNQNLIESYGNSIAQSIEDNMIHLENHSVKYKFQLQTCPLTQWKYFYGLLPVSILDSDDEDENNIGLQPRYLIFSKVFELFRHFQVYPVLQPSIGRIRNNKILLFDGQHKAASLLWNGRKEFECKIYLNPDLRVLNQTNIAAHDSFAQTRFFSSVLIQKLGSQFGNDFEAYKNIEDNNPKTEKGFLNYLERVQDTTMKKIDRNKRFKSYLYDSILGDERNKIKDYISSANRSSKEQPLTVDMLSKSILSCFLCTEPVDDNMTTEQYKRELEFTNNITLLNIIYDNALCNWNSASNPNDVLQLQLERIFSSKCIMAWSEIFRDAVCAKLDIIDGDEKAKPFYRELSESDFIKVTNIFKRLLNIQIWKMPKDSEIDTIIASKKSNIKDWLKSKGLTTGYLLGAQE